MSAASDAVRTQRTIEIIRDAALSHLKFLPAQDGIDLDAWAASLARNATMTINIELRACPHCAATLPRYSGLCSSCAAAPDHEQG